MLPDELAAEAQVLAGGRVGHQDQAGHARLEHDRVGRVESQHDALADAIDVAHGSANRRGGENDRSAE